jgi:hypothetical protein
MKWSRLKSLAEERFAAEVKHRVALHSTAYGQCTCGRFWITVDGRELANLCTRAYWNRRRYGPDMASEQSLGKFAEMPVEYGEFSRQQAYQAVWQFVHDLSIDKALVSDNPLHQALAVLDARVGRRRLEQLEAQDLHPLVHALLEVRLGRAPIPGNENASSGQSGKTRE